MKRVIKRPRRPVLENYIPIPESGCWIWIGRWDSWNYGEITSNGRFISKAHRAFYEAFKGEIPAGMVVCHKCDTPACVNPDHLFVGTLSDNTQDMVKKGRGRYGPNNPSMLRARSMGLA